jgi:DNA-binding NarL/FixJ family response regulator
MKPRPNAGLYDLSGRLGPVAAGLHGFRGYAPPNVTAERLVRCLSRVAGGEVDAPRPHLVVLNRVLEAPPLNDQERQILQHLAWGRSHKAIITALGLKRRTFEDHLAKLIQLFEATGGHHLGAIAVALGLAAPFEHEPPDWAQAHRIRRPRRPSE